MKKPSFFKVAFAAGAMALAAGLVGCSGSGGGGGGGGPILPAWYDVYGNFCFYGDPEPGCNFYANGDKIIDIEDPWFVSSYNLQFDIWLYYDSFGDPQVYTGYAWLSPSGILYDDFGVALNKEKDNVGTDLVADVGEANEKLMVKAGENFAQKYSLQADVGMAWARGLNKAMELRLGRSRSKSEMNSISKSITGVSFAKGEKALRKALAGDDSEALLLNDQMARHMRTTASNTRSIMEKMFDEQFEAYENAQKTGEKIALFEDESDAHQAYLKSDEFKKVKAEKEAAASKNADLVDDLGDDIL